MVGTQVKEKLCKQWEAEMDRLNAKYNLDCFFQALNSIQNWMKENNISMSMDIKHLFNVTPYQ